VPASASATSRLFVLPVATRRWVLTDNKGILFWVLSGMMAALQSTWDQYESCRTEREQRLEMVSGELAAVHQELDQARTWANMDVLSIEHLLEERNWLHGSVYSLRDELGKARWERDCQVNRLR